MSVCLAIVFKKSFLVLNNFSDQVKEEKEEAKMSGVIMEQNGFRSRSEIVAEDLGERDMSPPMVRNKFTYIWGLPIVRHVNKDAAQIKDYS